MTQYAALGDVSIEETQRWISAVHELGTIGIAAASSECVYVESDAYLLPEDADMTELSFVAKGAVKQWIYAFRGTEREMLALIDQLTVVIMRDELDQSSTS